MNYIVTAYCIYLPLMLALTIWVANTIHKNTRVFLVEIFPGHETVASAVNNLLQTGFYLLALGFGFLRLRIQEPHAYNDTISTFMTTQKEMVEVLAVKLGSFTLFIGFLLFFNLILMLILRRGAKNTRLREEQTRIWIQKQQEYQQLQQQQQGNYPGGKK